MDDLIGARCVEQRSGVLIFKRPEGNLVVSGNRQVFSVDPAAGGHRVLAARFLSDCFESVQGSYLERAAVTLQSMLVVRRDLDKAGSLFL